jgi:hypothetical protein
MLTSFAINETFSSEKSKSPSVSSAASLLSSLSIDMRLSVCQVRKLTKNTKTHKKNTKIQKIKQKSNKTKIKKNKKAKKQKQKTKK